MEMLAAMMAGAVGGVVARAMRRGARGRWPATSMGILGGFGAWWTLDTLGPSEAAGPLLIWHLAAGAIAGAALVALTGLLLGRIGK